MSEPVVGHVAYATEQGLGHVAREFYRHGVVTETLVFRHPDGRPTHVGWYPPDTPVLTHRPFASHHHRDVYGFLERCDVVVFYETPFDWALVTEARRRGVATALVTMYEWFPERPPARFDLYLCPSRLDYDVFSQVAGPSNCVYLPFPAPDPEDVPWRRRGAATRFLHNAGHVGSRHHKGTDEVLRAIPLVRSGDARFTVRFQDAGLAERVLAPFPDVRRDPRVEVALGSVPYGELFSEGDVYLAPEKYNGLSLPLQEAYSAGLAVMTTDRYPTNTWLPNDLLVPPEGTRRVRAAPGHLEVDESVVTPEAVASYVDAWVGKDVGYYSEAGARWRRENSWAALGPRYLELLRGLVR